MPCARGEAPGRGVRRRGRAGVWLCLLAFNALAPGAPAGWEDRIARAWVPAFTRCEDRLTNLNRELESLPQPYLGEVSGSIGYLSRRARGANRAVNLHFVWQQPVRVDAVAIVPMRYMTGGALVNDYEFPETFEVYASGATADQRIQQVHQPRASVPQSLPVWIEFEPVTTGEILLRLSGLIAMPDFDPTRLALSEVYIFSGEENVAPLARLSASSSIESFPGVSLEHLNDEQTPLGLPELAHAHGNLGLRWGHDAPIPPRPLVIKLSSSSPQEVTGLRLFPVHDPNPAQGFPVRFTVDFMDEHGRIVFSCDPYATNRFPNPGLNPVTLYCTPVKVTEIRLNILELWHPTRRVRPVLLLSEITPLGHGQSLGDRFEVQLLPSPPRRVNAGRSMRSRLASHWDPAHIHDGLTQAGRIIPLRAWVRQLSERRALLEEFTMVQTRREQLLSNVRQTTLGVLSLVVAGVIGWLVARLIRSNILEARRLRRARDQIASDLHDEVGSSLSSVGFHVEHLLKAADDPQSCQRLLTVQRLIRESIYGLREVLHATSPAIGHPQNIVAHMRELAQLILVRSQHTFEAPADLAPGLLTLAQRKDLILLFKEAITNAEHHSGCRQMDIRLTRTTAGLVMEIADDGCGMNEAQLALPGTLRTLKHRAASLHAGLQILSQPGQGTRLIVTLPLAAAGPAPHCP